MHEWRGLKRLPFLLNTLMNKERYDWWEDLEESLDPPTVDELLQEHHQEFSALVHRIYMDQNATGRKMQMPLEVALDLARWLWCENRSCLETDY